VGRESLRRIADALSAKQTINIPIPPCDALQNPNGV
jgi:hypothetical protein